MTSPDPPRTPAPAKNCPGCGHDFHPAGLCRALLTFEGGGTCACRRNMVGHFDIPQPPMQRLMEHQRKDEHDWSWNRKRQVTDCTECSITRTDWEQMRQARAQLAEVPPEPAHGWTALERQLTGYLATSERQLDAVDRCLPVWKGTGRGRVETIVLMKAEIERLRAVVGAATEYLASHGCPAEALCGGCRDLYEALDALDGSHAAQPDTR